MIQAWQDVTLLNKRMSYTVTQESFDSLASYWTDSSQRLKWGSVFVLPPWLKVWWREFKPETELCLSAVKQGADIIGIAPLMVKGGKASLIGSVDVCDYLDFVIVPGKESDFFNALLDDLSQKGIDGLDLRALRPDSTVLTYLAGIVEKRGYEISCHSESVSVELDLPANWEEYLALLDKKQRHEVRRKLRRLWEADEVAYRCVQVGQKEVGDLTSIFLKLFSLSREEKANFMTTKMESFFNSLAKAMAEVGLLRYGILEIGKMPVAMIMGFDYNDTMYLYNSAYDPQYNSLSVGLLSKVLCLKESITRGKKKWDFLKGAEEYKYQLGGGEITLDNCQIIIR
ncbi:GNAT family N-acetyltransferase [Chloroflexota bacterium]